MLRGATGLAAAVPFGLVTRDAAAAARGTSMRVVPAPRGRVEPGVTILPEVPLDQLSVPAGAQVRLRTAAGWSPWRVAGGCPGGRDDAAPGTEFTALVAAAGATAYQVRNTTGAVTELSVPGGGAAATGTSMTLPRAAHTGWRPRYLSRAAWGADESYRYNPDGTLDTPPAFFGVQTLTVHHSGEDAPIEDPIEHIRAVYYNQAVTMDWGDIGYQLLIDADGRVYEGVYSDPDPIPVFGPELSPAGLPMMVNGSHVGGFNAGNIGVCVLGNTMLRPPTTAAVRSLTVVLALLAAATRLDPEGTTDYVNPISGATARIRTIAGHQDWHNANPAAGATLCPGDGLYARLPAIRRDVARLTRALPA